METPDRVLSTMTADTSSQPTVKDAPLTDIETFPKLIKSIRSDSDIGPDKQAFLVNIVGIVWEMAEEVDMSEVDVTRAEIAEIERQILTDGALEERREESGENE